MNYYNQIARGYSELYKEEQFNKLFIIKSNIETSKETRILDIGCGNGISSEFDCFVVGLDNSIELLKQNKSKLKILSNAETLPFKDNSFNYVISVTSIHNFKNLKQSIKEIKRVATKKLIFSVLKKSKKFDLIMDIIKKNFKIDKIIDEGRDTILFCSC